MNATVLEADRRHAQLVYDSAARQLGVPPRPPWIGGAPDYRWDHLRLLLEVLPLDYAGLRALEFGCNAGASAILLAHLGATVSAVDVDGRWITLAALNAERYGVGDIDFAHVPDTRKLPYADGEFDLIACNSVLEYVERAQLPAVQRELDRVLAPGGVLLVCGTRNRLWLRGGLWPWTARRGFGAHYDNLDSGFPNSFFSRSRQGIATSPRRLALLSRLALLLNVSPGMLTRHLSCLLQKHGARERFRTGSANLGRREERAQAHDERVDA
jgi:2-polyprenyl-3-methyl-5-hydroxy-6-metoxy-1,4-benzoquinol methylase